MNSNEIKIEYNNNNNNCVCGDSDVYVINEGETLMGISIKLNININTLKRLNNIQSNMVFPGQILKTKIPQRTRNNINETKSDSINVISQGDENLRPNKDKIINTNIEESQQLSPNSSSTKTDKNKISSNTPKSSQKSKPTSSRVSQYFSSFFSKPSSYNSLPTNSPSKSIGKTLSDDISNEISSENDSASPPQVAELEKEVSSSSFTNDYVIDFSTDEPSQHSQPLETKSNSLHIVDKDFDAEIVEVDSKFKKETDNILTDNFIPILSENGHILKLSHLTQLVRYLPIIIQHHSWRLLYSVFRDGADFTSFYNRSKRHKITLVVVEATNGEIFGGLVTEAWHIDTKFYGAGQSFVFKIVENCVLIYPWTLQNDFVMWSSATQIAMGGGGNGFGFLLDDDFLTGQSNHSQTFDNPPLTSYMGSFRVVNVEVWGFDSVI